MSTDVKELEVDIDALFGATPGADSILVPAAEEKPSIFSKPSVDLSFIDSQETEEKKTEKEVNELLTDTLTEINEDVKSAGRPKLDKSALVDTFSKLIEDGLIIPFEDEKPLEEYSQKDWKELIQANLDERVNKVKEETPIEFFKSLPQELQIAAKYVSDGGQDLKGLFKALSQVEETRELDPSKEQDQEAIVRNYLRASNFGTEEDIDEEIDSWRDMDKLGEKATKFKPKLDKMQEAIVNQKIAEQETRRQQQQEAAETYTENVYNVIKNPELNGIKLDTKTQSMLYSGLVQPSYPSISGRPTNLLGHLLEKYQFIEPRHDLIAEALWLLADPDAYKDKIREAAKTETVKETVRSLKTEESRKTSSSSVEEKQEKINSKKIVRPSPNFFKR